MKTLCALTAGLVVVAIPLALTAKEPAVVYDGKPGPYAVETACYDWQDKPRQREVPVKIYFPKTGDGPFPVIIFSHGLGGSRDGYEYLGRHWASHGYVSVHLQHKGSDTAVWKDQAKPMEAMRQAIKDLRNTHQPAARRAFRHRPNGEAEPRQGAVARAARTAAASAWPGIPSVPGPPWR